MTWFALIIGGIIAVLLALGLAVIWWLPLTTRSIRTTTPAWEWLLLAGVSLIPLYVLVELVMACLKLLEVKP